MHDAGLSGLAVDADDEWQEQLLADSESEGGGGRSSDEGAAAAVRGVVQYPAGEGFTKHEGTATTAAGAADAVPSKRVGFRYQG